MPAEQMLNAVNRLVMPRRNLALLDELVGDVTSEILSVGRTSAMTLRGSIPT
jgi:hypothetical protein